MAQISMGELRWRMLRRVLRKKKFRFEDTRNMSRNDRLHFDWLVAGGFFKELGEGLFEVTDLGHESADLGYYDV